ncbi:hypothetical protein OROHE_008330 [Orobanche hederae]
MDPNNANPNPNANAAANVPETLSAITEKLAEIQPLIREAEVTLLLPAYNVIMHADPDVQQAEVRAAREAYNTLIEERDELIVKASKFTK